MTTGLRPQSGARSRSPSPGVSGTPPERTQLQKQGPRTLYRHLRREIARFAVLSAMDLATFVVLRAALRALRDDVLAGVPAGGAFAKLAPPEILAGWPFGAGLLLGLVISGAYGPGDDRRDLKKLFVGTAIAIGLAMWGKVWVDGFAVVPGAMFVFAAVWGALSAERTLLDHVLNRVGWRPQRARTVMIGSPSECATTIAGPAFANGSQYRVIARLDLSGPGVWQPANAVRNAIVDNGAEAVVICGYLDDEVFALVIDAGREAGCELLAVPRRFRQTGVKPSLVWEKDQPLIALGSPELKAQQLFAKRVMDTIGALLGLVVLSPFFAMLAAVIKSDSRGRVFFTQERVGMGGRVFRMWKFRTMHEGADDSKESVAHLNHTGDPRLFKIPNDPRVTRVGARLRRWSLDELPQLWNVLKGDMSLVGPRPFFESDLAEYTDQHFRRLGAKPGITGLWQVRGRSLVVEFEEVVRLDREYIDRWSIWLDLRILAMTLPAVLRRTGAF